MEADVVCGGGVVLVFVSHLVISHKTESLSGNTAAPEMRPQENPQAPVDRKPPADPKPSSLSLYRVFYWFVWVDVTFFMGAKGWKSNLHVVATPMAATTGLPPLGKGMVAGPRCIKTGAGNLRQAWRCCV